MNRLPRVLQNEIWEYVRGDRAYWKQIFSDQVCSADNGEVCMEKNCTFPGGFVEMYFRSETHQWWVRLFDDDGNLLVVYPPKFNHKYAMATFNRFKHCHKF